MSQPLYLHCRKCIKEGMVTKMSALIFETDLFIMCDNHKEPIIIMPAPEKTTYCEHCHTSKEG
jgi:hypothetical protein